MVKIVATSLLLAAAAQANPIFRRQDISASASDLSASASGLVSSALESASVLPSSAVSASAAASSGVPEFPAYPCPQGLLTYVEVQQAYPGVPLEAAVNYLSNWAQAVPYPIVNSTGTNETGATRTYTVETIDISEILVNQTIDAATGALTSESNVTTPISTGGLTIFSANNVLSYYRNETTSESTGKVFSNFCASDQALGATAFEQLLQGTLAAYGALLAASGASSGASSGVASSMMPSQSGVVSSASNAVTSGVSAASSAANGALNTATSVLASVA